MAFNETAFSTTQFEVPAVASTAVTIPTGIAVKSELLPVGIKGDEIYHRVSVASSTDIVFGVVSARSSSITDKIVGRVIMTSASAFPVLMNATAAKGDFIKVKTMDGKWEKVAAGETADAQLLEAGTAGNLSWAQPIHFKP